jgi:hypothetical protein
MDRLRGDPLSGLYIWIVVIVCAILFFPQLAKIWFSKCLMETIVLIALGVIEGIFGYKANSDPFPGDIRRFVVWMIRIVCLISIGFHFLAIKVDFVQPAVDKIDQWKSFGSCDKDCDKDKDREKEKELVEVLEKDNYDDLPEIEYGKWREFTFSPEEWTKIIWLSKNQRWSYESPRDFKIDLGDRVQKLPAGEALVVTDRSGLLKIQPMGKSTLPFRIKVDRIGPDPSRYKHFTCLPGGWTETVYLKKNDSFEFDTMVPVITKIGDSGEEKTLGADGFLLKAPDSGVLMIKPESPRDASQVVILIYEKP